MTKNLLFLTLTLLSTTIFAYVDSDMDGVEDAQDRCQNTLFTELVDINGCTKKSLVSPHHYDIIVGASYSDSDYETLNTTDTLSATLQVDYYYKNFSLQAATSYFTTEGNGFSDSGLYDLFLGTAYQVQVAQNLFIRLGLGAILPTYETSLNNNNTDYTASLNLSYRVSDISIFGGYSYTLINDDDVSILQADGNTSNISYQSANAYSLGLGYYASNKLYLSGAYNTSDSIYTTIEDIETLSAYAYYGINEHWFSTFSYAYGLSDSASKNYVSLQIGYFF